MPLQKLSFRPGVNKESTTLSNEGGWFSCDKVRFRSGFPEKIGGWTRYSGSTDTLLGTPRSLHPYYDLQGSTLIGIGTHRKYYIESGERFFNITPVRLTVRRPVELTGVSSDGEVGTVTVST